jgi:hypothetical protein
MVRNLVTNSREAISKQGVVELQLENIYLDAPVPGYNTVNECKYTALAVRDDGIGIPVENIEKIFEPFYIPIRLWVKEMKELGLDSHIKNPCTLNSLADYENRLIRCFDHLTNHLEHFLCLFYFTPYRQKGRPWQQGS